MPASDPERHRPERERERERERLDHPHQLVCGLCEAILEEIYPTRAKADQAADRHAAEVHPGRHGVIVLALRPRILKTRPDEVLSIAIDAQHRTWQRNGRSTNGA